MKINYVLNNKAQHMLPYSEEQTVIMILIDHDKIYLYQLIMEVCQNWKMHDELKKISFILPVISSPLRLSQEVVSFSFQTSTFQEV